MMNIIVLAGGLSTERNVSFQSGDRIAQALRRKGHRAIVLDVFMGWGKEGDDLTGLFERDVEASVQVQAIDGTAPDIAAVRASRKDTSANFFGPNVLALCQQADIVFMALHGADGENGKVQAAFDLMGIRYTGSTFLACALAMDKGLAKQFMRGHGIPCPHGYTITKRHFDLQDNIEKTHFPCVVKPACGGSSIGVTIVHNEADFNAALEAAFRYEDEVVVEDYIEGREFAVGVLDGVALPVIEIIPKQGFYNYENKYQAGAAEEICPADLDDEITNRMQMYAERVVAALGLSIYSRMDFIVDEKGDIYCLEANSLPGMTDTSLIPQEAAVIGIPYDDLCEEVIQLSMERYDGNVYVGEAEMV